MLPSLDLNAVNVGASAVVDVGSESGPLVRMQLFLPNREQYTVQTGIYNSDYMTAIKRLANEALFELLASCDGVSPGVRKSA